MSKLLTLVKKLMAQAEGEAALGNDGAAKNFAEKVQELIETYNLDVGEIEAHGSDSIGGCLLRFRPETWHKVLLSGIAIANSCQVAFSRQDDTPAVIGYKADIELVVTLYEYFARLAEEFADQLSQEEDPPPPPPPPLISFYLTSAYSFSPRSAPRRDKKIVRTSYLLGFADSVAKRFMAAKTKCEDETREANPESTALLRIDNKAEEVKNWMTDKFELEKAPNPKVTIDREAYEDGAADGDDVALTNKTFDKRSK